jgi:DNA end-binding protein Ku
VGPKLKASLEREDVPHVYAAARSQRTNLHQIHVEFVAFYDFIAAHNAFAGGTRERLANAAVALFEGQYVLMEDKEIKKLAPSSSKTLELLTFTKLKEIDPIFFDSSYFCLPEDTGKRTYQLLVKALENTIALSPNRGSSQ